MANPIKVIKGVRKVVKRTAVGSNKDVKTNKNINKKLEQAFGTKTISQGKAKAAMRMAKAGQYDSNTKGLGLAKGSNKKTAKQNLMANKLVSNLKNTKPMENVPKDVSNRFNATVKKLAAESVKKNRGK